MFYSVLENTTGRTAVYRALSARQCSTMEENRARRIFLFV